MHAMSMNSSFSNASTPPQRTTCSPASRASASRVDALYERQPQVSFIDAAASEDDESMYSNYSPAARREDNYTPASTSVQGCWSCRQTQRLRTSLKRIELDYLAQIDGLQQQLKHAVAQRAMALRERDELLTSADAAATQQSMVEQEAQALRVEVMQVMQERQELRSHVQELERRCRSFAQQQLGKSLRELEAAEGEARQLLASNEEDARSLRSLLFSTEQKALVDTRQPSTAVQAVTTPRRCDAASGTLDNGSTILSSTFSPNSTSSPGPSDGGRERRTCSPRPSQRRDLSSQPHTQRPSLAGDSARSASEFNSNSSHHHNTLAVSRALVLTQSIEEAEEKARRAEWKVEQQRSDFEMRLAEERALTADMQAEVDDLIENELTLLEAEGRLDLEKNATENFNVLCLQHLQFVTREVTRLAKEAAAAAVNASAPRDAPPSAQADVLDLVEEGENATWRMEVSETMSTMQQQLYQLLSTAKRSGGSPEDFAEVLDCVREETAEMKEALAALLDTSAQSRVDGDALLEEMRGHFGEVEERQCRQEAFLVAMSSKPASREEGATTTAQQQQTQLVQQQQQQLQQQTQLVQDLRQELAEQRKLTQQLFEMLQSEHRMPRGAVSKARATPKDSNGGSTENRRTSLSADASAGVPVNASIPDAGTTRQKEKHCDPTADMLSSTHTLPSVIVHTTSHHGKLKPAAHSPNRITFDDQLSNMTTVSDSTVDREASPSQSRSRLSDPRFLMPEEALFDPQRIQVDVSAAAEQISALLSDASLSDDDSAFPSPYEEF